MEVQAASVSAKTLRRLHARVYPFGPVSQTPLEQLLAAISDPRIRDEAATLIKLSTEAVDDLSQLDERIYRQHDEDAGKLSDRETAAPVLKALATDILQGVRTLEAHLQEHSKQPADNHAVSEYDAEMEFNFDFETGVEASPESTVEEEDFGEGFGDDFGDFDGFDDFGESASKAPVKEPSIADLDFDGAFDMLGAPEPVKTCLERWRSLLGELESFAYALGSQIRDFDERFAGAIEDGRFEQALRELNDVGRSVTDGVFALMTAIYEAYLDDVDRDGVLPGHESTLARALSVRRGLTDLRLVVQSANAVLQSGVGGDAPQDQAFAEIVAELDRFIGGDVFGVMRPADRLEIKNFSKEVSSKTRSEARFDCEGLDKYLDSLAAVSQRDVLIKHDGDQKHDILELLEAVKPLLEISPHGALDMIAESFAKAEALYGVREGLDRVLGEWEAMSSDAKANPTEAAAMSQKLDGMIREMP
tara:strand:+ start:78739 stop:80166 length:1428 start_codon:yes stop_codon:yes gene_type:complete